MANDEEVQTLDDETLEQLEQVRKGKPRKFVMLCKGVKIIGLVVFKKGTYDKQVKAAKKAAGTGIPYFGVVDGRGPNIVFKLATTDGFDKEPVKKNVLKEFLAEEAEYKAMPEFQIVSELGPVLDGDDPLVQRFQKLQEAALAACDKHPDRVNDITGLCGRIGKLLDGDEPQQADGAITELERLLGTLGAGPGPSGGTTGGDQNGAPAAPVDNKLIAELNDALKRLKPEVDVLTKAGVGDANKLNGLLSESAVDRDNGDFAAAIGRTTQIAEHLEQEWARQAKAAEDRVNALLSGSFTERGGDVEKIKTVLAFAQDRAGDGRHGSALVALANLRKLLDAAEGHGATKEADVIEKGTVEARKKLVESRWQQTLKDVRLEIESLRPAIFTQNPDEDADELVGAIDEAISDFCDEFNKSIFNFGKAKQGDQKALDRIIAAVEDYHKQIDANPLIRHLEAARGDLGVNLDVAGRLHKALDEIQKNLES